MSNSELGDNEGSQLFIFGEFRLDVDDRQLWLASQRLELKPRYFDALALLVKEHGNLIEKQRFFSEVWAETVVSDHALTQCIKEIRKVLGDDASNPQFVQTVPRHGYRFIGSVILAGDVPLTQADNRGSTAATAKENLVNERVDVDTMIPVKEPSALQSSLRECLAGTLGGALAGLVGGMFYGFGLSSSGTEVGTLSTLLVLVSLNVLVGLTGGFGVSAGYAGGGLIGGLLPSYSSLLRIVGAALGGFFIGAVVQLLGIDAFNLLLGSAPEGITGGMEGAILGALVTTGAVAGKKIGSKKQGDATRMIITGAAIGGALAGGVIPILGGNLMGGSLHLLTTQFAGSNLNLASLGSLYGDIDFSLLTESLLAAMEGFLFGLGIFAALTSLKRISRSTLSM